MSLRNARDRNVRRLLWRNRKAAIYREEEQVLQRFPYGSKVSYLGKVGRVVSSWVQYAGPKAMLRLEFTETQSFVTVPAAMVNLVTEAA